MINLFVRCALGRVSYDLLSLSFVTIPQLRKGAILNKTSFIILEVNR
jgi:hypothetical protein